MRDAEAVATDDGTVRLTVVVILKGAFVFAGDLVRNFRDVDCEAHRQLECEIEFLVARSRPSEHGQHSVELESTLLNPAAIRGKQVLVVEDIFDSGRTLQCVVQQLKRHAPQMLKIATLLDKPSRRAPDCSITADYIGFEIPDLWVVGYGLDEGQLFRNLPYIDVLDRETRAPATLQIND